MRLGDKFHNLKYGEIIDQMYKIPPNSFILAMSNERVSLPKDLVGIVEGKSTLGRFGLTIENTASFLDSGFDGHITIEISNVSSNEVPLIKGMPISNMRLLFKDGRLTEFDSNPSTENPDPEIYFAPFDKEIFQYLSKHPKFVYDLSPRQFEELIAEILKGMGFEVKLTPASRDGGRDVFAYFNTPIGKLLTIVECKRYMPGNNVGIDVVERFLWTINEKDRASCGLIATTSQFTSGAVALQKKYAWKLQLKAYEDLQGWIKSLNADFLYSKDEKLWVQNNNKPTNENMY